MCTVISPIFLSRHIAIHHLPTRKIWFFLVLIISFIILISFWSHKIDLFLVNNSVKRHFNKNLAAFVRIISPSKFFHLALWNPENSIHHPIYKSNILYVFQSVTSQTLSVISSLAERKPNGHPPPLLEQ